MDDKSNRISYHVIGVMSGTSLDGVDLAECWFEYHQGRWEYCLGACQTIPYPNNWQSRLMAAIDLSEVELKQLDIAYTAYLADTIATFVKEHQIGSLDAVCSHGHTVHHRPEKGYTLQIGNLPYLASLTGYTVICDFRVQDVALGGQGAPLVPVGDHYLFATYDYCLNLGGFANCSFDKGLGRQAFDICPVNIVLNPIAQKLGLPYDDKGDLARSGRVDQALKRELDQLEYYFLPPPKSLGYEWVKQVFLPFVQRSGLSEVDTLATLTAHMAGLLAAVFDSGSTVLATGGGAFNAFLIESVVDQKAIRFIRPDNKLVEFKEALIFAFLGILKLSGLPNCLASVTGASHDHSSGVIYQAT